MIKYTKDISNISEEDLNGFFVGWPNPPSNAKFLNILRNSYRVYVAVEMNKVVGFITAVSDGVLSAYIPLLEVLPEYQDLGIGKELVNKMIAELSDLYMVDLLCDENLVPFYEKLGMNKASGTFIRNYKNQSGI